MRNLTTASLELATWIGKLGSFTAAAERLYTTQPAVSARVRELEETVGQKLFLRQGRGVELTIEGREFVRSAAELLRQVEDLSQSFSKSSAAGIVRMGASSICLDMLAALSLRVSQTMPKVSYDVEVDRAGRLLDLLEARKLDIALVSGPVDQHKFKAMSLGFDRMLWVTSPQVLAERQGYEPAKRLEGLQVWCTHRDSFYWSDATRRLLTHGVELERVSSINNTLGASRIVSLGAGIGLLSENLIHRELLAGTLVPIPGLAPCEDVEFSIVCMQDAGGRILGEIMEAAVATSPFRQTMVGTGSNKKLEQDRIVGKRAAHI